MRSLFLKIFLWFWTATILIIVSTLVLMSLIEPYRPLREDGRLARRLAQDGTRAVRILEMQGPGALKAFIEGREQRPGRHYFLFNEKTESLSGGLPPADIRELAVRARETGETVFERRDNRLLTAQSVYGSDGSPYIIVGEAPYRRPGMPLWRFLNPRFLSLRLLVIFVVAGVFCYWLAWYLTLPVRRLRTAAQQIASGDLKARVGPELAGRKDELSALGHDFDLMAERIESLIATQGRLLRDISHELRSPLARLNVALELARRNSGGEASAPLDRIEREAERLNELIGQLRTLTLLESGAGQMDKKPVDISRLVRVIADDADFEAKNRNCSVKAEPGENIIINGSEELLHRAVENVVRNAVSYTAEGTAVEISVLRREINGQRNAVITVRDHGPGVQASELDSLFRPLYRISEARERQSGGMGIGLAITELSIRLHNGSVKAANHPDGGLVIEMTLPAT